MRGRLTCRTSRTHHPKVSLSDFISVLRPWILRPLRVIAMWLKGLVCKSQYILGHCTLFAFISWKQDARTTNFTAQATCGLMRVRRPNYSPRRSVTSKSILTREVRVTNLSPYNSVHTLDFFSAPCQGIWKNTASQNRKFCFFVRLKYNFKSGNYLDLEKYHKRYFSIFSSILLKLWHSSEYNGKLRVNFEGSEVV